MLSALLALAVMSGPTHASDDMHEFTVIAHRGASGYLPEHTLEGVAMAHAQGADYIEQDVVLTADDQLIVLHDLYLDATTDVARRFAGRQRPDGRHYAIDFTLDEIRTLRVGERLGAHGRAEYPGRYPPGKYDFEVPTLQQEIELIEGLNRSTGRRVGLYIEPKAPAWHQQQGKDLMAAVVGLLDERGYRRRQDLVLLQSFDFDALKYARRDLGTELTLVQLIGENSWRESPSDFDYLRSEPGLREIAEVAQGIGPWLPQLIEPGTDGSLVASRLARDAQQLGLFIHGYTLRADRLPAGIRDLQQAVDILAGEVRVDGVFTDHVDQVIRALSAADRP